jgi:N6-adenosine-specific RNA methylase IME4
MKVIMIDPPWPQKKGGKRSVRPLQNRSLDYKTMSLEDIFFLLDQEIFPKEDENHAIFLWVIDKFLPEVEVLMKDRKYRLHARMIWDKGNGMAPAFTVRFSHEYVLWYYKPKLEPIAKEMRGKFKTVIQANSREHSRKPDEAYSMIESLYPNAKRLDVFSRQPREGWDQFGDQCSFFQNTPVPLPDSH